MSEHSKGCSVFLSQELRAANRFKDYDKSKDEDEIHSFRKDESLTIRDNTRISLLSSRRKIKSTEEDISEFNAFKVSIPQLLEQIDSNNETDVIAAIKAIRKLISKKSRNTIKTLFDYDFRANFVKLLTNDCSANVKFNSLWLLSNLGAKATKDQVIKLVYSDLFPVIVNFLDSPEGNLRNLSYWLLANFVAKNEDISNYFLTLGLPQKAISFLKSVQLSLAISTYHSSSILTQQSSFPMDFQQETLQSSSLKSQNEDVLNSVGSIFFPSLSLTGVQVEMTALQQPLLSEDVLERIIFFLANVAETTPEAKELQEFLPFCIANINCSLKEVQYDCLRTLETVSSKNTQLLNAFLSDNNFLPRIIKEIKQVPSSTTMVSLSLLGQCVNYVEGAATAIVRLGGVPPLVSLSKHSFAGIAFKAMWVLSNIAGDENPNTATVVVEGGLDSAVKVLSDSSQPRDTRIEALQLIGNVLCSPPALKQEVANRGVMTILCAYLPVRDDDYVELLLKQIHRLLCFGEQELGYIEEGILTSPLSDEAAKSLQTKRILTFVDPLESMPANSECQSVFSSSTASQNSSSPAQSSMCSLSPEESSTSLSLAKFKEKFRSYRYNRMLAELDTTAAPVIIRDFCHSKEHSKSIRKESRIITKVYLDLLEEEQSDEEMESMSDEEGEDECVQSDIAHSFGSHHTNEFEHHPQEPAATSSMESAEASLASSSSHPFSASLSFPSISSSSSSNAILNSSTYTFQNSSVPSSSMPSSSIFTPPIVSSSSTSSTSSEQTMFEDFHQPQSLLAPQPVFVNFQNQYS